MATYCVKMPLKSRQNQGSNGFSSRGTPSNRPDLWFIPQPKEVKFDTKNAKSHFSNFFYLTLKLLIATIVVLEGFANSKTCPTYDTPDATIQTKCSYIGRKLILYKHTALH